MLPPKLQPFLLYDYNIENFEKNKIRDKPSLCSFMDDGETILLSNLYQTCSIIVVIAILTLIPFLTRATKLIPVRKCEKVEE